MAWVGCFYNETAAIWLGSSAVEGLDGDLNDK